jgi:serine/threonine-protein kinase
MGTVYRAYQANLKREVAVKVLPVSLANTPGYIQRFTREAETAASLEHPHIVPVYDYGTVDGVSYVVMRLLPGGTLAERAAIRVGDEGARPSLEEIASLLTDLASALDYAHSRGVIHRDLKPSNVMFDNQGNPFLVDFGIAKVVQATEALTRTGMTMGTPTYMAPEQWMAEQPSPATDQYAVGVMVYALVTGRTPFEAPTPYGLMHKHLHELPAPPQTFRAGLPEAVTVVINRAMAKKADERFPTMTEFAGAFQRAIQGFDEQPTGFFTFEVEAAEAPVAARPGTPSGLPVGEATTPLGARSPRLANLETTPAAEAMAGAQPTAPSGKGGRARVLPYLIPLGFFAALVAVVIVLALAGAFEDEAERAAPGSDLDAVAQTQTADYLIELAIQARATQTAAFEVNISLGETATAAASSPTPRPTHTREPLEVAVVPSDEAREEGDQPPSADDMLPPAAAAGADEADSDEADEEALAPSPTQEPNRVQTEIAGAVSGTEQAWITQTASARVTADRATTRAGTAFAQQTETEQAQATATREALQMATLFSQATATRATERAATVEARQTSIAALRAEVRGTTVAEMTAVAARATVHAVATAAALERYQATVQARQTNIADISTQVAEAEAGGEEEEVAPTGVEVVIGGLGVFIRAEPALQSDILHTVTSTRLPALAISQDRSYVLVETAEFSGWVRVIRSPNIRLEGDVDRLPVFEAPVELVVGGLGAYLLEEPALDARIIGSVVSVRLPALEITPEGDWALVEADGQRGWVRIAPPNVRLEGAGAEPGARLVVGGLGVYILAEANLSSKIVATVRNEKVDIVSLSADERFVEVEFEGETGWIRLYDTPNLRVEGDLDGLPRR